MTTIWQHARQTELGARVHLYQLDLANVGAPGIVVYFTNTVGPNNTRIKFKGVEYESVDVKTQGFEKNGVGPIPQPRISISNVNRMLSALVLTYQDLIGARLTRLTTFDNFLDGGPDSSNPLYNSYFYPDIYVIEQKTAHNKVFVEFQLSSAMDQQGRKVPGRVCLRDRCPFRYRAWNPATGSMDYSQAVCPYNGGAMWDAYGNPTSEPTRDQCGKSLSDCIKRFGWGNLLPFGGFPGMDRT